MFRLEIHASGTILADYEGQDAQMLLDNARSDGWIDWEWSPDDDAYITEDAWKHDGVSIVILYESWDGTFNDMENIMEIKDMENLEEYEEDE